MGRGMAAFPAGLRLLISTVLVLLLVPPVNSSLKNNHHYCPPSSCGNIPNISYPFRLKGDPANCGDQRYELSCDNNNHTLLSLNGSKYYVSQINYNDYTIRLVDSGIQEDNYSFIPRYFLNYRNFSWPDWSPFSEVVVIVYCEKPVTSASPFYSDNTISTNCSNINKGSGSSSNSSFSQDSKRHLYLIIGYGANVMDVEESCTIEQISLTSRPGQIYDDPNISCTDIRNVFSDGFEVSWFGIYCGSCGSYDNQVSCFRLEHAGNPWVTFLLELVKHVASYTGLPQAIEKKKKRAAEAYPRKNRGTVGEVTQRSWAARWWLDDGGQPSNFTAFSSARYPLFPTPETEQTINSNLLEIGLR